MENLFIFLGLLQILVGLYLVYQGDRLAGLRRRRAMPPIRDFIRRAPPSYVPARVWNPASNGICPRSASSITRTTKCFSRWLRNPIRPRSIVKRVASQSRGKAHVIFAGRSAGLR